MKRLGMSAMMLAILVAAVRGIVRIDGICTPTTDNRGEG